MTSDGRFPRLNPAGAHVACGAAVVSVSGVAAGPGTTPQWLNAMTILYTRQPDGALMRAALGASPVMLRPAGHEPSSLCCDGNGRYAYRDHGVVETSEGRRVEGVFRPTWAAADLCWCVDTGQTADLYREGVLVARTVHDVRGVPDGRLCFIQVDGPEQWTCIQHLDGRIGSWRLAGAQEYHPLVLDILGEEWVLSHTRDARLLLRTGNNGVVVAMGDTFEPDAAVLPDGRVRVVWADAGGVLRERTLTPPLVTQDLRTAPVPPEEWDAPGTEVDCAPFFDVQGSTVPRTSADGQVWQVHRRGEELYICKGAQPHLVEVLLLTPDDVRLAYDATDGRYPRAWRLDVIGDGRSDVRWCRNVSEVGWTHTYTAQLVRRTEGGPSTSEPFPFLVGVEQHGRHINYGGDVGVVDRVLVTRFEPHVSATADGYHELHHWAIVKGRALGLVRYDEVRGGVVARTFTFNRDTPARSVPMSSLVVHPIPDAPASEPIPMSIPEPTITDPEAANAGGRIEHFYTSYAAAVGYQARTVHTDPLSYVWGIRYYQARQRGLPHEPAIQAVERAMGTAAGVLEPEPDPDPQPDPVGRPPAGPLRRRGRVLYDDQGDRLILSCSMFHATTLLQHERGLFDDNLAASVEAGVDEWRIGGAINWPADIQDERPTEPGHVETLVGTIDRIWQAGLRTDLCLFLAQVDVPELRSLAACESYTQTVCRALRDRAHMVRITIANEPGDGSRIWGHGLDGLRRMRDIVRAELPGVLVSLGAPFHPTALATTDWTAGSREDGENAFGWFEQGCDITSPHYSRATSARRNTRQPWLGRRDSTLDVVLNDEEPIGPHNYYDRGGTLTGLNEQRGDVIGMQRTAAWICGHAITTFHSGAGIGYQRVDGPQAYLRLRAMPGLFDCAAAKAILPGNLPAYRVANWHWSLDQGQLFERFYEPSDRDGTPATRGHCASRLDQFVAHEFFADAPYELRARARVQFSVWERQGARYVQIDERGLGINDRMRFEPALDRVLIGRLT